MDLGFNLLRSIPPDAFSGISSLTLLALDGNPMPSVPEEAFRHLNASLKGLSLGGRFLTCDCRMAWIPRWIRDFDLQVTSRERNPQFCGNPSQLRERSFYQLNENGEKYRKNQTAHNPAILKLCVKLQKLESFTSAPGVTNTFLCIDYDKYQIKRNNLTFDVCTTRNSIKKSCDEIIKP